MRLTIRNVAKIKEASFELDGITVVAGENGSGKSTAAKALPSLVSANSRMNEDIEYQKKRSISRWLEDYYWAAEKQKNGRVFPSSKTGREEIFLQTAGRILDSAGNPLSENSLSGIISDVFSVSRNDVHLSREQLSAFNHILEMPEEELESYVVLRSFRERFGEQVNSSYNDNEASVSVACDNGRKSEVVFAANEVRSFEPFDNVSRKMNAVFLEAPARFDSASPDMGKRINPTLMELLMKDVPSDEIFEDYRKAVESLKQIDSFIDDVIHGSFIRDAESRELTFRDDQMPSSSFRMCNVASGVKVFAVLRRLVQNRSLNENDILVIDEPETGLHPEWQIKLARLLILMVQKMNIRVFLTTHSLYFLRAVEVLSSEMALGDRTCYYLMKKESDNPLYKAFDVNGKTEEIYRELYRPLEEL